MKTVTSVPSTAMLLGIGSVGLAGFGRRRRRMSGTNILCVASARRKKADFALWWEREGGAEGAKMGAGAVFVG